MSSFKSDLNQEAILSSYLDKIYKTKGIDFDRISDSEMQHRGIDIVIKEKTKEYFIDEKAQLHYINTDLPTFTFELSYLKNNVQKDGWLLDENKLTHYYFLITGIFLKKEKNELLSYEDIEKVKITSVDRKKLRDHLDSMKLDKKTLLQYNLEFRKSKSYGKNTIAELNPNSEGLIYFTEHLAEKPINLQLRLSYLIEIGVAKKFHYVESEV